jgi:hypothetical protein
MPPNDWIPVAKELPPRKNGARVSEEVIVSTTRGTVDVDTYDHLYEQWLCYGKGVEAWMPKPLAYNPYR